MPTAVPFPSRGITLSLGSSEGAKPTKDWIGTPSQKDIELFLWFVIRNPASRQPTASGHQTSPMQSDFCSYSLRTPGMRGSDITRRIYACARLLEITGESNWEACRKVAGYLEDHLGKTRRGPTRNVSAVRDFLNNVNTVRSIYNQAKRHHRWKEKLPEQDLELEHWWRFFLFFKGWAEPQYYVAVEESNCRGISIESLCKEIEARPGKAGAVVSSVIRKLRESYPPDLSRIR